MKGYLDLLKEAFDSRHCPSTVKAFLSRKFSLPGYRAPDYFNQDDLNQMALMYLILLTTPGGSELGMRTEIDEVTRNCVANILLALSCDRPTLFLERDLGEILLDSNLPEDLDTADIKKPFPSIRIMLPKGLLPIERSGVACSMMYLDIGFLDSMQEIVCPDGIAKELDLNSLRKFREPARVMLSRISFGYKEDCILITGSLDKGETDYSPTAYGITKPWAPGKVSAIRQYRGNLDTDWPTDDLDSVLMSRMENLALNILLLLSRVPVEYEPLHVERKARTEGKRMIPALLRAKFVGDCLLRARKEGHVKGEINGYQVSEHYRRAHWTRQPCGPRWSQRKLIWLLPIHVGKKEAA